MTKNQPYAFAVLSEQALRALEGDHWNTTPQDQEQIKSALQYIEDQRTFDRNQLKTVIKRTKNGELSM